MFCLQLSHMHTGTTVPRYCLQIELPLNFPRSLLTVCRHRMKFHFCLWPLFPGMDIGLTRESASCIQLDKKNKLDCGISRILLAIIGNTPHMWPLITQRVKSKLKKTHVCLVHMMTMSPYFLLCPRSGQYFSLFLRPFSSRLVVMTMTSDPWSQTILQKSWMVFGRGPCSVEVTCHLTRLRIQARDTSEVDYTWPLKAILL